MALFKGVHSWWAGVAMLLLHGVAVSATKISLDSLGEGIRPWQCLGILFHP